MKKIVKKALSLMLALVMVFTLAPVTANAATNAGVLVLDGETVNQVTYTESIDWVNDNRYYYTWTPEANGKLVVTAATDDLWIQCYDANYQGGVIEGAPTGASQSIDVTAGTEYTIWLMRWSETAGTVGFTAEFEESTGAQVSGSGTMQDPYVVTETMSASGLGYGQTAYYKIVVDNPMKQYTVTVTGSGMSDAFAVADAVSGSDAVYSMLGTVNITATPALPISSVILSITNQHFNGGTYAFAIEEYVEDDGSGDNTETEEYEIGSYFNPDTTTTGNDTFTTTPEYSYWVEWTADAAGVVTFSATTAGATIGHESVSGSYDYVYEATDTSASIQVAAGDVVLFYVYPGTLSEASITTVFEVGAVIEQDQGGVDEEETNYEMGAALEVGTNEYVASLYPYTVYTFDPTEAGEYTISSTDSVLGIVSYNGMWVTIEPSAETVSESSLVWECTSVGQSIWVAAMPETNISTITVTKDELDDSDEIPWTDYENVKAPTAFEYKDDASKLQFVDIEDGVSNTAVLGEDGYYHLDKADGPILFVNLNDQVMSLVSMVGYGKVAAIYYENEEVVEKVDYTEALLEYIENADIVDEQTTLYPLTADLIEIYQEVGASNNWYDADNEFGVGSSEEDAWMFACYYDEAITSLAPSTDAPSTDSNTSTSTPSTSVETGDNVNVFAWVAVMMLGLATVAVVLRKRAR